MWICRWLFKDATKILNGRQKSTLNFFVGVKTLKLNFRDYINFGITFLTIWRCAGFAKIQHGRHGSIKKFLRSQKLEVLNYANLQSHSPRYGDVHVIFSRFYENSIWLPNFTNFVGAKSEKLRSEIMCRWFYGNLKWQPQVDFLNISTAKTLI